MTNDSGQEYLRKSDLSVFTVFHEEMFAIYMIWIILEVLQGSMGAVQPGLPERMLAPLGEKKARPFGLCLKNRWLASANGP
jgi:hypothetical protein